MAESKLKTYKVKAGGSDVYCISIVDSPAVESNFIALAKQEKPKTVQLSTGDKHMLYGVILRADFPIYRCYGKDEFYVEFDAECIERLSRKYMKNMFQRSWTKEHMEWAEGLTLTESWLVTDPENDKSKALGLTGVTPGSWVGGCLVDDNETWAQIKEGTFNGFSVEAFVDLEELHTEIIKNKSDIKMAKKKKKCNMDEVLENIKNILTDVIDNAEGEDTQTQEEIVDEAAQQVVDTVEETKPEETTDENMEEETQTNDPEEIADNVADTVETNAQTTEEAANDLQAVVDELQKEVDDLKAENEELKKKNQKMSKMPSTSQVKGTAKQSQGFNKDWRVALSAVYKK